jgi:glycosyltransferase involved in cell wall biosynthesis
LLYQFAREQLHKQRKWQMRVLISVDPELPVPPRTYGGVERIADGLVKGLRLRGHEIGLIAHYGSTCVVDKFYPWYGLHSQNLIDSLRNTNTLRKAANSFQPNVLHSFSRLLYMLPLIRSTLPKIMSYGREPTPRTVRYGAMLANGSLTFTACSEYIRRRGARAGGNWRAIHNFVDIDLYQFQPKIARDAPLVFLSRIERIKGAHTAIAVARRTGRRLVIAGNHADSGPELEYWEQEILPQLGSMIEYIGPVDDAQKNALLGQAAALIVPIEWEEPFGLVFAEAMACGTPVISTPRGALPEIVRQGVDGFLIGSIEEACNAVTRLEQINRRNCRDRVERNFSIPVIVAKYEQLYMETLSIKKNDFKRD